MGSIPLERKTHLIVRGGCPDAHHCRLSDYCQGRGYIFGDLFANEPERRHFAEYLTGLMVAEKKTVSGINSAFVVTTDQSCLNRWLNEVGWDAKALNDRRLQWLQGDPKPATARGA